MHLELKEIKKTNVLRMRFSIVENVPTSWESIFTLSRGAQLPYMKKNQKIDFIINYLVNFAY